MTTPVRRTGPLLLSAAAVAGGVVGWLLQVGLTAGGSPTFVPAATLWAVLFVLAGAVLVLGWPVRRSVHGRQKVRRRVDPFYAMRVLVLAKASSLTGALLAGASAALVVWSVSRPDLPFAPAFWPDVVTFAGAVALLAAGLTVETWCRIPPEDRAELPTKAVPGTAEQHR